MMTFRQAQVKIPRACVKCGMGYHNQPFYRSAEKREAGIPGVLFPVPECMNWPCSTCGYTYQSLCADQKKELDADTAAGHTAEVPDVGHAHLTA